MRGFAAASLLLGLGLFASHANAVTTRFDLREAAEPVGSTASLDVYVTQLSSSLQLGQISVEGSSPELTADRFSFELDPQLVDANYVIDANFGDLPAPGDFLARFHGNPISASGAFLFGKILVDLSGIPAGTDLVVTINGQNVPAERRTSASGTPDGGEGPIENEVLFVNDTDRFTVGGPAAAVPEPATAGLGAVSLAGLTLLATRRR